MVNAVSLVLMKGERILLLNREKNRMPIIVIRDNETPEKCIERWTKDNVEIGSAKIIKHDKTFKVENYNINLIFIDCSNSEVKLLNEDLVFENCSFVSNLNKVEEGMLRSLIIKCGLLNYKSFAVESLARAYSMSNAFKEKKPFIELEKGRMDSNKAIGLIGLALLIGALFSVFVFNYLGVSVPIIILLMIGTFIKIVGIKNKSIIGFFFLISSFILSITYGIFTNEVFRVLNLIVIPISLFSGFLLLTYDKVEFKAISFIAAFLELILAESIENTTKLPKELKDRFGSVDSEKKNGYMKYVIKGLFISIPTLIVLLMLLSGADEIFNYYLSNIWDYINIKNIYDFIIRFILASMLMFIIYGLNYGLSSTKVIKVNNKNINKTLNSTTVITVLVSVILVYLVFTKIQVSYLYLNKALPEGFSFSEYARKGFFQLVFLVFINLVTIITIKLKTDVKNSKVNSVLNIMYSIITLLTLNMGTAAIYKMNLYISEFGYTRLRILVQVFTLFLCISLVLLLAFIIREKVLFKPIAITAMIIYIGLNYINIDNFIAKENIKLIEKRAEIDLWYLSTLSLDAKEALSEGRKNGVVSNEYYNLWVNKKVLTEHWYEYNYMNENVLK
ncbi:DUF4173 domain-containing protein [Clostridium sp. Sa3CUN1]|uniref:DUF4173 domain-containing protein n=1 Tax=Clostridium gallinarum TaxID=2762246 RepID=A0ABR8PZI1_9CLOT|nr:DUF4173 domain-containing protein [Clostridium gallinarum]MBD7913566.1 DUF4173 domain-containing protein [Clostridium gallinarum]